MQIELPFAGVAGPAPTLANDNEHAEDLQPAQGALDCPRGNLTLLGEKLDGWEGIGSVVRRVVSQCDCNRLRRWAPELYFVA